MDQLNTDHKDKIPKDHSYPLGNMEISDCLEGFDQYDQISLRFRYQDCYWASEYKTKLKQQDTVTIMVVEYNRRDELWSITVSALPKEYRNKAHSQLVEMVLPKLLSWLEEQKSKNRKGKLSYGYDLYREVLSKEEHRC